MDDDREFNGALRRSGAQRARLRQANGTPGRSALSAVRAPHERGSFAGRVTFARSERARGQTLSIVGEIDMAVRVELDSQLASLIAEGHPSALVDLSGVTFMDSTGTHSLISAARAGGAAGSPLVLVSLSESCRHMLEVSGAWGLLELPA